jgi:adenylyltransferase/sulfurtransferase
MKTDSARRRLSRLNSGIRIETAAERIDDSTISGLAGGMDLIIDCLDSFSSRHVLNRCSVRSGIPLVHAGLSGTGGQLTIFAPPESGCLSCLFPETDEGEPEEKPLPVLGTVAGILGTLEAMEAIKLISGLGEPFIGRLLIVDVLYTDFREIAFGKEPGCPVCGQTRKADFPV